MVEVSYTVVGRKSDGVLEVCRALPDNRGRGRCPHGDHIEVSKKDIADGVLDRFNEEVLSKSLGAVSVNKRDNDFPNNVSENAISSHSSGRVLSRDELLSGAQKIADNFTDEDWAIMRGYYNSLNKSIHRRLSNGGLQKRFNDVSENVAEYLKSDDVAAIQTREFLGDGVDLDEFSRILTHQVKAMTCAEEWRGSKSSIRRIILTSLDNDMTRERYTASVLFFGGRCCYCNCVLRKSPPPGRQASGEHLTPVSPSDPNSVNGGTRYGNMVLACVRCNNSRGNKELVSWVQKTNCIPEKDKALALGRIQAFRNFTLYHEYSPEENDRIMDTVKNLEKHLTKLTESNGGKLSIEQRREFKREIKVALYDLKHNNDSFV